MIGRFLFTDCHLILVCAGMRQGKSSLLVRIGKEAQKRGYNLVSNLQASFYSPYVFFTDPESLTLFNTNDSFVLIDEASIVFNSRGTNKSGKKTFTVTPRLQEYFSTLGHRNTYVFIATQSWKRLDTVLREFAQQVWFLRRSFFDTSTVSVYESQMIVVSRDDIADDDGSEIREYMSYVGGFRFWRKPLYKLFDTFEDNYNFSSLPPFPSHFIRS